MSDHSEAADGPRDDAATWPASGVGPEGRAVDRFLALAADIADMPWACLALAGPGRWAIAAHRGVDAAAAAALVAAFCPVPDAAPSAPIVVPDASWDARFQDHPCVAGAPALRVFVGIPLRGADGIVTGLLCTMGGAARPPPSPRDLDRLRALAALAVDAAAISAGSARALKRAEERAVASADVLADVSHEMRTPLTGIVGFATLLRRDASLGPEALRTLDRIEDAGHGLLSIVEDALDLSKLGSGQVRLDARPFSIVRLIEDAVALIRPEADRKGLLLDIGLPDPPPGPLRGDPDRLRQVLLNLLSNAVKFTEAGIIRVTLATGRVVSPRGPLPLLIAVEDSGMGLDSEAIPRLFHRFVQADRNVSRRFGGSGLGLAISKTLVDAMGGTIAVESASGVGSRFSIALTLPRAVDATPPQVQAHDPGMARPGGLRGYRVLLADDAPLNRKLVLQMLEPLGAEVDVVSDGVAAVAAVGRRDYALVLMDMEMPLLDGIEATRRIRAMGAAFARLPIVALTANVFPEQLDRCRQAGMDDHLTKPFSADDLVAMVSRWTRRFADAGGAAQ